MLKTDKLTLTPTDLAAAVVQWLLAQRHVVANIHHAEEDVIRLARRAADGMQKAFDVREGDERR